MKAQCFAFACDPYFRIPYRSKPVFSVLLLVKRENANLGLDNPLQISWWTYSSPKWFHNKFFLPKLHTVFSFLSAN